MRTKIKKSLVLLDRDGTLIEERHFIKHASQVRLLPGVPQALRKLKKAGFPLVVVSNQSGVGRGLMTRTHVERVNRRFLKLLQIQRAPVDALYWCPHHPKDRCSCRKPKLGMVKQAARALKVPWRRSISVGDRPSDVILGQRTGGAGILVLTGYGRKWTKKPKIVRPDHTAATFRHAADWILKQERKKR
jgi:histidinol-phosphate phosphatase family protein